jgi:hypothetical protein
MEVARRTDAMSDILRRKRLRRIAFLGSVLLTLVCMALFGAARFFAAWKKTGCAIRTSLTATSEVLMLLGRS